MEDNYEIAFDLILNAGNSKSKSIMAVKEARNFNFEKADALILEAKDDLNKAHQTQTRLLQNECNGAATSVSLITVHAQDHLTMAFMALDNAKEFTGIYKLLSTLTNDQRGEIEYE